MITKLGSGELRINNLKDEKLPGDHKIGECEVENHQFERKKNSLVISKLVCHFQTSSSPPFSEQLENPKSCEIVPFTVLFLESLGVGVY